MKNHIKILAAISVLAFAVASKAQVVIGNWQNNTGDGWIDNGNGLSITNVANAVKYQFVSNAVAGYAQSLEINQAGYNQNLEIDLNTLPGGKAAFLANNTLSFTVTFPSAAASGATAGYSQIYNFTVNCGGSPTGYYANIPWTNWVGNGGAMPGVGYYTGFGGQTITVSWNYSSLLTNSIIAAALTNSSTYLQLSFTSNNGGGAPTNIFMNNVALSGAITTKSFVVDDFSPAGVGPQNPVNYDYYTTSNNYAAGQITNVWGSWFGNAFQSVAWDPSNDANNNTNSGALEISLNFANDQFVIWDQGTPNNGFALNLNGSTYTNFQCDVRFAPGSASNGGSFGELRFGDRTAAYGQDWFGNVQVASTNTNWVHVNIPLNSVTDTNLANIQGIIIGMDASGDGAGPALTGASTIWVDNIKFTGPAAAAPITPPTLSIQQSVPALRVFAGSTANTYDREELTTVNQSQSWIGGSYPVSYSFTLLSAAGAAGFQTAIFIIPTNTAGNAVTGNEYIDYQATNSLWLQIQTEGNGVAIAQVAWKTNLPNANPNNVAANITNSTAVGTWTLKFTGPTSGMLTAPGAAAVSFNISDVNVTADFGNPAIAIFGIQPNSTAGEGQYVDYSQISITGVTGGSMIDNFTQDSSINTGYWDLSNSAQPSSLVLVTTNTPYWISWTLPDTGFGLGSATSVLGSSNTPYPWMLPEYYNNYNDGNTIPGTAQQGIKKWTLIPKTCLPTVDGNPQDGQALSPTAFFRLVSPPLQN